MTCHRSTGPIPPEQFQAIVNAPYGRAAEEIRKYDPLWGRGFGGGVKTKWCVSLTQDVKMATSVLVDAATKEEAAAIAAQIRSGSLDWDVCEEDVVEVETVVQAQ